MTVFDAVRIGQEVFAAQQAAFWDGIFNELSMVRFLLTSLLQRA